MNYGYPAYLNSSWAEQLDLDAAVISTRRPPTQAEMELRRAAEAEELRKREQEIASAVEQRVQALRKQVGLAVGLPLFGLAAYGLWRYWQGE
jgi:hypothetical protein